MLSPIAQSRPPREELGDARGPGRAAPSLLRHFAGAIGVSVALFGATAEGAEEPTKPVAAARHSDRASGPGLRIKVAKGETAIVIARRHGTTVKALCAANGLADPHRIYAGQILTIPVSFESEPERAPADRGPSGESAAPAEPSKRRPSVTLETDALITDVHALSALAAAPSTSAKLIVRPAPLAPRARLDASRFERFGVVASTQEHTLGKSTLVHGAMDVTEPLRHP